MNIDSEKYPLPYKWFWNKAWLSKGIYHLEARASYPSGRNECETKIVKAKELTFELAYNEILNKITKSKWKIIGT